jgi:hypothetical protein
MNVVSDHRRVDRSILYCEGACDLAGADWLVGFHGIATRGLLLG